MIVQSGRGHRRCEAPGGSAVKPAAAMISSRNEGGTTIFLKNWIALLANSTTSLMHGFTEKAPQGQN
jgi:hypothetical protein